jgi:putative DNA primase/helicase
MEEYQSAQALTLKPAEARQIHPLTDLGNADLFAEMFHGTVHYVPELNRWIVWSDGKWWSSRDKLMGLVRQLIEMRRKEAKHHGDLITHYDEHIKHNEVWNWVKKSQGKSRIDAMLQLAMVDAKIFVPQDRLDRNPYLVGVKNGTLELVAGVVREGRPEELITQLIDINYNPDAECERWLKFIDQVTCGHKDLADYIQESLGYALSGSVQEQQLFVLAGKGKNGKSTLVDVFLEVMGGYGKTTPAHTLMKSESRAIRNDIARLRGARFVSAVEINTGKQLDEALVKRLTGGDKITARFIGREYFEYSPQAKFFLAVNTLPEVNGADDGIYRRIRIIPFEWEVHEDKIEKDLPEKLKAEKAGILAWAVKGFQRWKKRGNLSEPSCVVEASSDFRTTMDTIGSFLKDVCERKTGTRIPKGSLFAAYQRWSKEACVEPVGLKEFGTLIRQQGFKESKSGSTRFWQGLTVRTNQSSTPPPQNASPSPHPPATPVQ